MWKNKIYRIPTRISGKELRRDIKMAISFKSVSTHNYEIYL